ncbi:MAG TPA: murein L,D-transpeptidase family protein [Verrucomicrobiales bacterium]|nr:murein L,D-transpeptidase family protein [Verrucomicrobiales bacterium]
MDVPLKFKILLFGFLILCFFLYLRVARARGTPQTDRVSQVKERLWSTLVYDLKKHNFKPGAPVFIRIFKESSELELWLRDHIGGRYRLYSTYRIANWGGQRLGPKLKKGDCVAPEGFYHVGARQLKPDSQFHLAFNVGYPNAYDKSWGRTGDYIMVHGNEVSIGCFAMTDPQIELIYLIVEAALRGKQDEFQVHIFPFRMTAERLAKEKSSEWYSFWTNLKEGYDHFERDRVPPLVGTRDRKYVFKRQQP